MHAPEVAVRGKPEARPTEARFVEIVFPERTNHYGTLFGGQALALMAKAAFVASSRYARRKVVLARSEPVDFHAPVRQGQLVELVARVASTGTTSLTVDVDMQSEDLLTGVRRPAAHGGFVFVALDDDDRSTAVPPLPPGEPGKAP